MEKILKSTASKEEFVQLMFRVLNPLKKYYSKEKAGLKIGYTSAHYPDESAWMEGFSRPLWALAPYFAGGGSDKEFEEIYRKGLISGTNPKAKEYWGTCNDYDQRLVEMAAIAYTLLLAKDKMWNPLTKEEKENISNWLNEINQNKCCDCNWRFFQILVNIALKKCDMPYSSEVLEDSLNFIESCYVGDGWYVDGENGQADYYIPFAMEFYGLVYAVFMEDEDKKRAEVLKERAEIFGKDFIYWFSEDGSALPYGRSLTYRFAQCAFYSMCVAAKVYPLPLSVMKGIIVRNLDYWFSKPIFDHAGLLTIGYAYPNLNMSESYNAPGSPYWAMKAFAFLALQEDDMFFKCKASPLPELDEIKFLSHADMIIQRRKNGNVIAFPGGRLFGHVHGHTEEKYSKFAYSTKYGFSVMRSMLNPQEAAQDSVLSFELFGHIFIRGQEKYYKVSEQEIISHWSPIEGIKVHSTVIPKKEGHTRIHVIDSEYDCIAYDAGFAVPIIEDSGCKVVCVKGEGEAIIIKPDPNTNLVASKTWMPTVKYQIKKGRNFIETDILYD